VLNKQYEIVIKRKIIKTLIKLPRDIDKKFNRLIKDLRDKGPILKEWPNFSKLEKNKFHCHLNYKWVAVWVLYKSKITIEVTYVGSRENAPY